MLISSWTYHTHGEPDVVLRREQVELRSPMAGELRVRVEAASANLADALLCQGRYFSRPALPCTPGIELSGVIEALDSDLSQFRVGQRVVGLTLLPHGSFADAAIMPASKAYRVDDQVGASEGSSLFGTHRTALHALRDVARLQPGETLLVHGAGGGVGSSAVQIGRALGAMVIAVTAGARRRDAVSRLGADIVLDRLDESFESVIADLTAGRGVDVAFDPVGGDVLSRTVTCMAADGRIAVIGMMAGSTTRVGIGDLIRRNLSVLGVYVGTRTERSSVESDLSLLTAWMRDGTLRHEGSVMSMDDVPAGLRDLLDGHVIGRLVFQHV